MEAKALKKKIKITLPLILQSGLHIGGSNTSMSIGDEASVMRDPMTNEPIIPGSSMKGKMRSLTEKLLGAYHKQNMGYGPYQKLDDESKQIIPELYGTAVGGDHSIPSRIIVRDAYLTQESVENLNKSDGTDMLYSEIKTENTVDRVSAVAMPRDIERVPAGSVFTVETILNVFEHDDEKKLADYVKVGFRLVEDDYIGGHGSRGSGHIEFDWDELVINQKTLKDYEAGNTWQPHKL